ncbi:MAG: NADP-dependent malic enzyme [Erysipelotrichia bacterium]|nr:NADP-dependent malic enzyme [Erysipelotrichia bacterium]
MRDSMKHTLKKHKQWRGKIATRIVPRLKTKEDLSIAYSPGVADPVIEISKDKSLAYDYTWKGHTIAVVSDGSAILGLGNLGAEASLPVMEGKAALFKSFGGVDAIPIVLDTQDTEEIIKIVKAIAPGFGGVNLEDISAPRCVEIERRLQAELDIPIFHDDQHGTAIVVCAALINGCKLTHKKLEDLKIVVNGAGAAGSSIIKMIHALGVRDIQAFKRDGVIHRSKNDKYDFLTKELSEIVNPNQVLFTLEEAFVGADVFIGVSVADCVTSNMVASMNKDAMVFALANPNPEIPYDLAKQAGARIVGTGRSDYPNQINNVLAFPGLFKGALNVRARAITESMKVAAAYGIAACIEEHDLRDDYIVPSPFNPKVAVSVASAVENEVLNQK